MITRQQVKAVMQRWECAGLVPPAGLHSAPERIVESFIERFPYMDELALEYISAKVILGEEWPKFAVIEQLAKEYEGKNNQYVKIDYFKELRQKALGEEESYAEFVERIAERYFPGRGKEWQERYSFTLYFYGVCCEACKNCSGVCPRNGHRYYLRMKRGTSCPVPWGSLELCEKYKASVDRAGRVSRRPRSVLEEATSKADVAEAQNALLDDVMALLPDPAQQELKQDTKAVQQDMFAELLEESLKANAG